MRYTDPSGYITADYGKLTQEIVKYANISLGQFGRELAGGATSGALGALVGHVAGSFIGSALYQAAQIVNPDAYPLPALEVFYQILTRVDILTANVVLGIGIGVSNTISRRLVLGNSDLHEIVNRGGYKAQQAMREALKKLGRDAFINGAIANLINSGFFSLFSKNPVTAGSFIVEIVTSTAIGFFNQYFVTGDLSRLTRQEEKRIKKFLNGMGMPYADPAAFINGATYATFNTLGNWLSPILNS